MRGRSYAEPFILAVGLVAAVASGVVAWRVTGPYGDKIETDPRARRVYDPATGKLQLIAIDTDGDVRFDTWFYMDGDRLVRSDFDDDKDGKVDRRQYFGPDTTLTRTEFLGSDGQVMRTEPSTEIRKEP